tara:strand:- start:2569 stop:2826 length:258 start_codon:yes stop_codon:yes gene_type:complete
MIQNIRIELEADTINKDVITFTCPLCRKSIHSKKNDTHHYSSGNNTDNRIEVMSGRNCNRSSWFIPNKNFYVDFQIHITNNTIRI